MKTLPAGTLKFLLLDDYQIRRNAERRTNGAPVAIVLERTPDGGYLRHVGYGLVADGPVTLAYNADGTPVAEHYFVGSRPDERRVLAAFSAEGEVRLAETLEELQSLTAEPAPEPTPRKTTKPKKKEA